MSKGRRDGRVSIDRTKNAFHEKPVLIVHITQKGRKCRIHIISSSWVSDILFSFLDITQEIGAIDALPGIVQQRPTRSRSTSVVVQDEVDRAVCRADESDDYTSLRVKQLVVLLPVGVAAARTPEYMNLYRVVLLL